MQKDSPVSEELSLPASYERWRNSQLGRITDQLEEQLLFELIGDPVSLDILDVGCGDGLLLNTLAQRGARATGLDGDPRMLRAAARRAEATSSSICLVHGKAEMLPFADASFDRVVAVAMLCLVPDAGRVISEMARVLRPGGKLVVGELGPSGVWAMARRIRGWLGHPTWANVRYRNARELTRLLEAQKLEAATCRGAIFYPPSALFARGMRGIDPWLGHRTTLGASFIACAARKPLVARP